MESWFEANRRYWDAMTEVHTREGATLYDIDGFFAGDWRFGPIETAELGDVASRDVLHLQCHFGMDTLRLAKLGGRAVGLDISPAAIDKARELAARAELDIRFVLGNVYDAPDLIKTQFDVVFISWGALCWLPDMPRWAEIVAGFLKPGGYLYLLEGHPVTFTLVDDPERGIVPSYDYFNSEPVLEEPETSYSGDPLPPGDRRSYAWDHPISQVVGALLDCGMNLEFLHEHEQIPWRHFPCMVEVEDRQYRLPPGHPRLPMAYSLKAVK